MATRDVSPPEWNASGISRFTISFIASCINKSPVDMDVWLNNYSPLYDKTVKLTAGYNTMTIGDTSHGRIIIFIPPRGNTQTLVLKGVTGDTGLLLNPNGPLVLSVPVTAPNGTLNITAGGAVNGCRLILL